MKFNKSPYYDTFNENDNYAKVLFKPGYDVQARELNESQSILQNQIAKIGNHLFKNGSKIAGCSTAFIEYDYARLNDVQDGKPLKLTQFNDKKILVVGQTTQIEARIVDVTEKDDTKPPTLYLTYIKSGSDGIQQTFLPGEEVAFLDEHKVEVGKATIRCPSCPNSDLTDNDNDIPPTGKSKFFNVEDGTFYYNGTFTKIASQHLIIENYLKKSDKGETVSDMMYRVGFNVVESIVTVDEDEGLFDPALGYPNYTAPGADRHKIEMVLTIRPYEESSDESGFILLAKSRQNHVIEYKKDDTEYGEIMKEMARRTYETNGDFTVTAWRAKFYNELKKNANDSLGWSVDGKDENFVAILNPGLGYVKGYRINTMSDTVVVGKKARDTKKVRGVTATLIERPNLLVEIEDSTSVSYLNHTIQTPLSNQRFNIQDDGGQVIGSFMAYDLQRIGNEKLFKIYIYNLNLIKGKVLSEARKVVLTDGSFTAKVYEDTKLQNPNNTSLIFPLGVANIKTIRDNDNNNNGNTVVEIRKRLTGITDTDGTITFNTATNESFISPLMSTPTVWVGSNPDGKLVNITASNHEYSPTTLTLKLGHEHASQNISVIAVIRKTNQQENTKTLTRHAYTTDVAPPAEKGSVFELPHCDGYKIDTIKLVSGGKETDITSEYDFDNGQTDEFYTPAKIIRNVYRKITTDDRLLISYYYFEHSGTAGFFTVDSYAQLVNDVNLNLEYSDIPSYTTTNGQTFRLAECIDFRPLKRLSSDVPVVAMPYFNSTMSFDIEYYLGRADLLMVNTQGKFYLKQGVSSDNPTLPEKDVDAMPIYEIHIGAYTYSMADIKTRFINNRRYTMRDIGTIDERVKNLEYYTSLSLLEQSTLNMSIKDIDGRDRYKNGFLVDNFKNYYSSDVSHPEFKCGIDRRTGRLTPSFKSDNVRLVYNEALSKNMVRRGNMILPEYEHDKFMGNMFSTTTVSINPYFIFKKHGNVSLSPNIDTWSDDEHLPNIVSNVDVGVDAFRQLADRAGITGVERGAWVQQNQSTARVDAGTTESTTNVGGVNVTRINRNVDVVTSTTSTRTNVVTSVHPKTQSIDIEDITKDVTIQPYVRSRTIQFYATDMKPNTQLYAFFDGIDVTKHCMRLPNENDNNNTKLSMFGGAELTTDENGTIIGMFRIPAQTFFNGEKKFVLTNNPKNDGNADVETTRAETSYFAGGLTLTKQTQTLNVITPDFRRDVETETRTTTSTRRETSSEFGQIDLSGVQTYKSGNTTIIVANNGWRIQTDAFGNVLNYWKDPVAQGFKVDSSCFISKVGVYFENVDVNSQAIFFEIRQMINGYPTNEAIGRKEYKVDEIKNFATKDASKEFVCEFDVPIYVDDAMTYCIVVGGYSPETRLHISRLGEQLLNQPNVQLESPPFMYTMFRSLNGETWNAMQTDTMKFNLYRCVFKKIDATIVLNNDPNEEFELNCDKDPFELQPNSNRVRVYCKDHNLRAGDRTIINISKGQYFTVEVKQGMANIGQVIKTVTGKGKISDIKETSVTNVYEISIEEMNGHFLVGQEFVCEAKTFAYRDLFLLHSKGVRETPVTYNLALGNITALPEDLVTEIGGTSASAFSKQHIIREIESIDTFIIEVDETFTKQGRFGGRNCAMNGNIKADIVNLSGQYLTYNAQEKWFISGLSTDNAMLPEIDLQTSTDVHLDKTINILDRDNEIRVLGKNEKCLNIRAEFKLTDILVAPVLNIDSFSLTTVSNRIESDNKEALNKLPLPRYVPETDPTGGTASFKYISARANLKNPATDLKIYLDVNCPSDGSFDIYVKLFTLGDNQDEKKVNWLHFDNFERKKFSNGAEEFIEYDILMSEACKAFSGEFTGFRVKIVANSSNPVKPVLFQNLRAIAVT